MRKRALLLRERCTPPVSACMVLVYSMQANAAGCPKAIAGPTMNWVNSVCEARVETDDFVNPQVQACVRRLAAENHVKGDLFENCGVNKRMKAELCASWVKLGAEKNLSACIASTDTVPKEVSEGLGQ